jgi:hypothetical protein
VAKLLKLAVILASALSAKAGYWDGKPTETPSGQIPKGLAKLRNKEKRQAYYLKN